MAKGAKYKAGNSGKKAVYLESNKEDKKAFKPKKTLKSAKKGK